MLKKSKEAITTKIEDILNGTDIGEVRDQKIVDMVEANTEDVKALPVGSQTWVLALYNRAKNRIAGC